MPELKGFSGADLAALVREGCVTALKHAMPGSVSAGDLAQKEWQAMTVPLVGMRHLQIAALRVQPSVSRQDHRMYEALRHRLRSTRGHLLPEVGESLAQRTLRFAFSEDHSSVS
jgi:ribosome biogenesis ATPase